MLKLAGSVDSNNLILSYPQALVKQFEQTNGSIEYQAYDFKIAVNAISFQYYSSADPYQDGGIFFDFERNTMI